MTENEQYAYNVRVAAGVALQDRDYKRAQELREFHDTTLAADPSARLTA